jgi:DNA-binding transcriptional ArsR family regulator
MDEDQAAESLVFRAIADATRRAIVDLLREKEQPVQAITAHFSISRPAVSRHLRILREAGLVSESRQGRQRIYALEPDLLRPALSWLEDRTSSRQTTIPKRSQTTQPIRRPFSKKIQQDSVEPKATRGRSEGDWRAW